MKLKSTLTLLVACASIACTQSVVAQAAGNGPTALITTYRALPGQRVKFREIMKTEGVAQFERWRREGIIANYQALFTTYAGDNAPDLFVVIRFNQFIDLARWQRIEERFPGGLPVDAQAIAVVESSATADIVKDSSVALTTPESQFFVLQYDVLVDMPRYTNFVLGYAVPQFDAWEKTGALSSYASYVNQNPAGASWAGFIVLEYKDLKSLAVREQIRSQASAELAATNPAWKRWSEAKTAIRTEKAAIPARTLSQP